MNKIKDFFGNKWVGFASASILYVLWFVVWTGNWWLLLGVAVIYDLYISKYFYRYVWSKNEELCREKGGAMFYASNYSLGVNLMFRLNRELARLMNQFSGYEISMSETHHTEKKDAPSGTAVTLAEDIISRVERKTGWVNEPTTEDKALIPIESLRIGMNPGEHSVVYTSEDDVLEIRHSIKNRRTLAQGAVVAAEFLCGKQGIYTMEDLF